MASESRFFGLISNVAGSQKGEPENIKVINALNAHKAYKLYTPYQKKFAGIKKDTRERFLVSDYHFVAAVGIDDNLMRPVISNGGM